ncbi:MAG: hypothetical protein IH623_31120 [Verrucomicrobia bacterium]|nr:hypothetical protein [Verrucomicrobiota bacterium]
MRDSSTQWMVFGCCALYFATFTLLERRATGGRFWHWGQPQVWAVALLVLVSLHYAFDYKSASGSTYALTLLGGAVLGKGAVVWSRWEGQKFRHLTQSLSPVEAERVSAEPAGRIFIGMLVVLLAAAAFLKSETGLQFQYRGQGRWTGPWDNPNIFGMLMGVGCVLALGLVIRDTSPGFATFSPSDAEKEIEAERKGTKMPEIWR